MGRYDELQAHLSLSGDETVRMTFDAIGRVVGGLPASAYRHREWWANSSSSQARGWLAAGYRVQGIDMRSQRVDFTRTAEPGRSPEESPPTSDVIAGPVQAAVAVGIWFEWRRAGEVLLDGGGRPLFPELPTVAGVYRLSFEPVTPSARPRVYIGETDNLRRRLRVNYRTPGPSQQTSLRVHAALRQHLLDGTVVLDTATSARVRIGADETVELDLRRKEARLLAENAALVIQRAQNDATIENLG